MRTIKESIIGKRGSYNKLYNDRLGLCQGDIVYTKANPNNPYMYISDQDLIKKALPNARYDMSDGIIILYSEEEIPYFLVMSMYDENLEFAENSYSHTREYDIQSIWRYNRPFTQPKTSNELITLCKTSNLKELIRLHLYKQIR